MTWFLFIGVALLGAIAPWVMLAILALRIKEQRIDLAEWEAAALQAQTELVDIRRSARAQTAQAQAAQAAVQQAANHAATERWDAASRKLRGLP